VIPEGEERTRAILWLLADLNPGMPVIEALGYLRAVEAQLAVEKAKREKEAAGEGPYKGARGVSELVRDWAGHPKIQKAAASGDVKQTRSVIESLTGANKVVAGQAATTMVSLHERASSMPEPISWAPDPGEPPPF